MNLDILHTGELYDPNDEAITSAQLIYKKKIYEYNSLPIDDEENRGRLLQEMFRCFGKDSFLETPFYSNWGGHHVSIGEHVYANFNLTLVDDTYITIGDHTMIGPNVTLATASHPIDPELRKKGLQYNLPVVIGENCWIGAGVLIMPGVTIGDNSIIGAGSLVTKDIPANVVAFGSPCKIQKEIERL